MKQNLKAPKTVIKVKAIVRDKNGNPKFDDPLKIKDFMHRLTEQDLEYLEKQYGKDIYSD